MKLNSLKSRLEDIFLNSLNCSFQEEETPQQSLERLRGEISKLSAVYPGIQFEAEHSCMYVSIGDLYPKTKIFGLLWSILKFKLFKSPVLLPGYYDVWSLYVDDLLQDEGLTLVFHKHRLGIV